MGVGTVMTLSLNTHKKVNLGFYIVIVIAIVTAIAIVMVIVIATAIVMVIVTTSNFACI